MRKNNFTKHGGGIIMVWACVAASVDDVDDVTKQQTEF